MIGYLISFMDFVLGLFSKTPKKEEPDNNIDNRFEFAKTLPIVSPPVANTLVTPTVPTKVNSSNTCCGNKNNCSSQAKKQTESSGTPDVDVSPIIDLPTVVAVDLLSSSGSDSSKSSDYSGSSGSSSDYSSGSSNSSNNSDYSSSYSSDSGSSSYSSDSGSSGGGGGDW